MTGPNDLRRAPGETASAEASPTLKSWIEALIEKSVVPTIGLAIGAALTALGRQLTDSLLMGQVLLPLFIGAVLLATPLFLLQLMRRQAGRTLKAVVILGAEAVLLLLGSILNVKEIGVDPDLPRDEVLEALLVGPFPQRLRRTKYNDISVVSQPVVVTKGLRSTHVVFDFLWTKRDIADRTYVGRVELSAQHRRTTAGGSSMDPFVMRDMSLGPKQGWIPYFLGWLEVPLILAETEYFAAWTSRKFRPAP
jgi:hypothetical protein